MMMSPPTKFCSVPPRAIPIATPAEAMRVRMELVSTPKTPMIMITRKQLSEMETKLFRKVSNEISTFFFLRTLAKMLHIRLMMKRPMIKTIMAATMFLHKMVA